MKTLMYKPKEMEKNVNTIDIKQTNLISRIINTSLLVKLLGFEKV